MISLYRLLAKAGVKVSPSELAARASPTAPRRSDLPKLDSSLLHMNSQQQFPLPASMPPSSVAAMAASMMQHNNGNDGNPRDPEDLRIPTSSPFLNRGAMGAGGHAGSAGGAPGANHPMAGHPGMGSALLDTYLSMIAAAGGDSATMAAALGSFPGRAAAFAAQAAAMQGAGGGTGNPVLGKADLKANGKDTDDQRSVSEDREDEAIASDADISDTEDGGPDSAKPQTENEDSIAAEDN